jgi:transcriptional regulator with XRE-family HTH domain
MYTNPQRRSAKLTQQLRNQAGEWLRELRERRGLSQRRLAQMVGAGYHTFISQVENGRGRIPPDGYLVWAHALGVEPRGFVLGLMSYYDPATYNIVFGDGSQFEPLASSVRRPMQSSRDNGVRLERPWTEL